MSSLCLLEVVHRYVSLGLQWSLTADTPGSLPEGEADKGRNYALGTLVPVSAGHSPQEHAFPGHSDTTPVV